MKQHGVARETIIQQYNNLLQINPKDYLLFYETAEYLKDTGQYQEALDRYKKVIELHPRMEIVYRGMGSCYYNLGKPETALEYFEKARDAGYYVPDAFFEKLEKEINKSTSK